MAQLNTAPLTQEEEKAFEEAWPHLIAHYTKYSTDRAGENKLTLMFEKRKAEIKVAAAMAKNDIDPNPGTFEGMDPSTGFGMRLIRPDDLVPTAQGRTFDATLTGLTANSWYGYIHNGAIGAAYNAAPLYLRKELAVALLGFLSTGDAIVDELKWEINSQPMPVWNMLTQMRGTDLKLYEIPTSMEYLKPAKTYRSEMKVNAASGNLSLIPIGVTFVNAEFARNEQPTQPSTTAP